MPQETRCSRCHCVFPMTGRDYYSARTKADAILFLKSFWAVSALRKIPKRNLLRMYHDKMREVLRKRDYRNETEQEKRARQT